jgi:peptidoglycan-N-acetylglucosamine deacetylase
MERTRLPASNPPWHLHGRANSIEGRVSLRISWSWGVWRPVLRRLPKTGRPETARHVALTIDDAPMPDTTPAVLDLLDQFGATATFFLSGCRIDPHPDMVAEIVRRGHAVYAHGWDHIRLDDAGPERLIADMERCEALLARHRPTPHPYLVRLPYNAGWRNRVVHKALAAWQPGCQIVHWGPSTEDHLIPTRCTEDSHVARECAAEVARVLADARLPGGILLMHDQPINDRPGGQFKPAATITLMRLLLEGLTQAGYRTVPVTPLAQPAAWTRWAMVW